MIKEFLETIPLISQLSKNLEEELLASGEIARMHLLTKELQRRLEGFAHQASVRKRVLDKKLVAVELRKKMIKRDKIRIISVTDDYLTNVSEGVRAITYSLNKISRLMLRAQRRLWSEDVRHLMRSLNPEQREKYCKIAGLTQQSYYQYMESNGYRKLALEDIDVITQCLHEARMSEDGLLIRDILDKLPSFQDYFAQQKEGTRQVWVHFWKGKCIGYISFAWQYVGNAEITDFYVIPDFRGTGVGGQLMEIVERSIFYENQKSTVVIRVRLSAEYHGIKRICVRRGYELNYTTCNYKPVARDRKVYVDKLRVCFTKSLERCPELV